MIPRHIETIFCDDVRHEVGGKLSFMGIYSNVMFVQNFPIVLPKLCLSIKVVAPVKDPFRSLKIRILKNDETFQEIIIDKDQIENSMALAEDITEDERNNRVQSLNFIAVFSPIEIEEPCIFRVRGITENEEMRGIALRVIQAKPSDTIK